MNDGLLMRCSARIDSDELYWAIVEAPQEGSGRRARRRRIGYLLESVLPTPVEEAHFQAIAIPGAGRERMLVAAIDRRRLRDRLAAEPDLLILSPDGLPGFIKAEIGGDSESDVDVADLNLLRDEFEPERLRGARRFNRLIGMIAIAAVAASSALGLHRRSIRANEAVGQCDAAIVDLDAAMLGTSERAARLTGHEDLRLAVELRRLRQTRHAPDPGMALTDAAADLAAMLSAWPKAANAQVSGVNVTKNEMTVRMQLPAAEGVQEFVDGLQKLRGWSLQQPQIVVVEGGVQATMILRRASTEEGGA